MNAPLKIKFERSGGFTGIPLRFALDGKDLPHEEQTRLLEMLHQAGIFERSRLGTRTRSGADRFVYRITVEDGDAERTLEFCESEMPAEVRPLVDYLNLLARRARGAQR
ncbi:MAG: protealysin inhibitor emfourin [Anaerolineales bacterium]